MKRAKGEPWQNEKPKEMTPDEIQATVDRTQRISRGIMFLSSALAPTTDWHYAGKGVKLDTPDRPIFWRIASTRLLPSIMNRSYLSLRRKGYVIYPSLTPPLREMGLYTRFILSPKRSVQELKYLS